VSSALYVTSDERDQMEDGRFLALRVAIASSRSDPTSLTQAMQPYSDEELRFFYSFVELVEIEVRGEIELRKQAAVHEAKQVVEGT
jgi:hypothetical protein